MMMPQKSLSSDNGQIRDHIYALIDGITPIDPMEQAHRQDALDWISSGVEIFRLQKPDIPNKHLVSYFVPYDPVGQKILLVDHKKALLWLPPGGHVDPYEDPTETVIRECREELSCDAVFFKPGPAFVTVTTTVGLTAGHTDVSLWYILTANHDDQYQFDPHEFNAVHWFDLNEIPFDKSDPHLKRFVEKLRIIAMD